MPHVFTFEAIGTQWRVDTVHRLSSNVAERLTERVETFDRTYSRFRPDSLVADIARQPGVYRFPDDAAPMFSLYRQLYDCSEGAITPLIGRALEHLGYDAEYRLRRKVGSPRVPEWDDVMQVSGGMVTTTQSVVIDVGAVGKGYLVDLVSELLLEAGVDEHVIDASGDMVHRGETVERVGLESPFDPRQVIGVAELRNQALCASATHRRSWGDGLHHIIDPATGEPTQGSRATWVTSSSCAVADGLATALFLVEPAVLNEQFDYGFVRIRQDGSVDYSADFEGRIFV